MSHTQDTDPLYRQLISEDEVYLAQQKRRHHQRHQRKKHQRTEDHGPDGGPKCPICDYAPEPSQSSHSEASVFKQILDFVIPPITASHEELRRWRLAIGLSTFVMYFHIATACGLMGSIGLSGFAMAGDVKEIKVELLEQRLFETRTRQCTAQNIESKRFYAEKLQELLRKYRETAGSSYPQLPSCQELQ